MRYTEYHFITEDTNTAEILLALLSEFDFDTFDHEEKQLFAYIQTDLVEKNVVEKKIRDLQTQFSFQYTSRLYEDKNWNEEWEKNFQPVIVAEKILIRAPFHPAHKNLSDEIIIEPRMSFGTGHHESTYLMVEQMLALEFTNKNVLDAGCGTGILAIFAIKRGANHVLAIDNNEWAYNNSIDNAALNMITKTQITMELGELDGLHGKDFDIILANINKPIIIENFSLFKEILSIGGVLLVSGILLHDLPDVMAEAMQHGFQLKNSRTRGDWVCAELGF